ncbi:MAG: glycosyl transferase family 1, partial [Frankiales bacterium]|nr:glycosyl transferase family 1 [Frankiales bacterium]
TDVLEAYPQLDPGKVHVVPNGIDTAEYRPVPEVDVLERIGVDPSVPYALFVGRITRQKGVEQLLRSARSWPGQLVLCAGSPDTPEIAASVGSLIEELQAARPGVFWIRDMLPRQDLVQVLSHATVFVCPSVYEPLGIVNLEAMACGTAVVASRVGGIPEVVDDGVTGLLVDLGPSFEDDLANAVTGLLDDPARAATLGSKGRERAVAEFGWDAIAQRTVELYRSLL